MAKAQFHKNQRVYVKPVGTWALIERVLPHWTKGLDEPLRVFYDVGLGREFAAEELQSETPVAEARTDGSENWRILRARNKWQPAEDCARHPVPGTYPVVITGEAEWGGWRVPGAEYDLDPRKVEEQARLIASAPHCTPRNGSIKPWPDCVLSMKSAISPTVPRWSGRFNGGKTRAVRGPAACPRLTFRAKLNPMAKHRTGPTDPLFQRLEIRDQIRALLVGSSDERL